MDEFQKKFISYNKKDIYLTGEQIQILESNNIEYKKCNSINELINLIERSKDDDNYDELDWVQSDLAEFNYYHNTNK